MEDHLRLGDRVTFCSRNQADVDATLAYLEATLGYGPDRVVGLAADVASAPDMERLSALATSAFGGVDLWINNAATNAYEFIHLADQDPASLELITRTNLLGAMIATRQAVRTLRDQEEGGHIFNMDGAGSDGKPTPRFSAYGASKAAIVHLNASVIDELKKDGLDGKVHLHRLSPGMVTTELLMAGANNAQSKWFINVLAEKPETSAGFLVPRLRQVPKEVLEKKGPRKIAFLTTAGALQRIAERILLQRRKDKWVVEEA